MGDSGTCCSECAAKKFVEGDTQGASKALATLNPSPAPEPAPSTSAQANASKALLTTKDLTWALPLLAVVLIASYSSGSGRAPLERG